MNPLRNPVVARLPLLAALLATPLAVGQQFQATAAGTLQAFGGLTFQSYGPGPFGATPTVVQSLWVGFGRASVTLAAAELQIDLDAADAGMASAAVTLQLAAPRFAGARLQLASDPGVGSVVVSALGVTRTPDAAGAIDFEALTPAGGLTVTIGASLAAPVYTSRQQRVRLQWSYPGVVAIGAPTPGCLGDAVAWTRGVPHVGDATFAFTCANAHPSLGALCVIGTDVLTAALPVLGFNLWIDASQPFVVGYAPGLGNGDLQCGFPLPGNPSFVGLQLGAQFVLLEPNGCMPVDLSAANAVRITLQP